jgi:acyl-[acyl-carrier-protein]-phospholipid O-acyltransferase/long-chain-fatty-acid--[acyl-carrier-protein] ligase
VCGAEKLPMSLADDFAKKFGVRPLEGYGCTELSPVVSANLPDVEINGLWQINNRPGSIGPPLPGLAAKIVNPDTFEPLPLGDEGLLLIYGPNVMRGYLHKPEQTAQVVRDGWYATGDVGHVDEDGCITLTGRLSRFAKVGGEMVPLERIEEELHDILSSTERVCVVTCIPDEARGERLVVLHVQHEGLEVKGWWNQLTSRGLPGLWIPSERDFYPVSELPLLGSGKVNLKRVKEIALELAGKRRGVTT